MTTDAGISQRWLDEDLARGVGGKKPKRPKMRQKRRRRRDERKQKKSEKRGTMRAPPIPQRKEVKKAVEVMPSPPLHVHRLPPPIDESSDEETDEGEASPTVEELASAKKKKRPTDRECSTPRQRKETNDRECSTPRQRKVIPPSTPSVTPVRRTPIRCTPKRKTPVRRTPVRTPGRSPAVSARGTPRTPRNHDDSVHPGASTVWTQEKEERLCEMWAEATFMYNKKESNYKNNSKRLATKVRWAALLDVSGELRKYYLHQFRITSFINSA